MKKIIYTMMAAVFVLGLTACVDNAKEISDKQYQSIINEMGISSIGDVAEGVTLDSVYSCKIDKDNYDPDYYIKQFPENPEFEGVYTVDYLIAEKCGEQKTNKYYGCYALGTDEEQASVIRDEYIDHLKSQGYEFLSDDKTYGEIYTKETYAVTIGKVIGPVNWDDKVSGQYGLYIYYY